MAPATANDRGGDAIRLLLLGDVMTGRGIDQALPHRGDPQIYEPWIRNARDYVELAEARSGALELPLAFDYVWGEALAAFDRFAPHRRIANLETAVTTNDRFWPGKGIQYRMHPANVGVLTAADLDCCVLANNHVLDWSHAGLEETLTALAGAGIATAGAGADAAAAAAPAVLRVPGGRVMVYGFGSTTSGIPPGWAPGDGLPGVNLLPTLSERQADALADALLDARAPGDLVVASVHWGGNWGYAVPAAQRAFARRLVERGAVDLVHGHSSHHPKGVELHEGRAILYGCGDFVNDYEGIRGHEEYRGELRLAWCATLARATGRLIRLELIPFEMRRLRLERAAAADVNWLTSTLDRECRRLGTRIEISQAGTLLVEAR
ncbi:MAG: CapA family protein [Gammaproteobacteria bacterium]